MTTAGDGMPAGITLLDALSRALQRDPDRTFLTTLDDPDGAWSMREFADRAARLAGALRARGVGRGDRVGLLLGNQKEFFLADMAVLMAGGTPVSIYETASNDQCAHIIEDSDLSVLFVPAAFLPRLATTPEAFAPIALFVVVDEDAVDEPVSPGEGRAVTTLVGLFSAGHPAVPLAEAVRAVGPDDLLTLIYTAGTTGRAKGVLLTHRNLLAAARGIGSVGMSGGGRVISWLPVAHVADRLLHYYCPIIHGLEVTACPSGKRLLEHQRAVRPTWFAAVPRIWEKMKAAVEADLAAGPADVRVITEKAIADGLERIRRDGPGLPPGAAGPVPLPTPESRALAALHDKLGLDRAEALYTGTASTARHVLEFFAAIGLPVGEIYGSTETCACGSVCLPGEIRIGSAGRATPGMEIRLDDDGEILLRGEPVMQGYNKLPEATAAALTADGWYRTGDVGRLDGDGYLYVVDRKKELIISASGKNMSPVNIEAAIKSGHPLIGQVCVIGEARSYNTALIVLDADFARLYAQQHGVTGSLAELAAHAGLRADVAGGVERGNSHLSRVEQVKRFHILSLEWQPGGDELTPTMKLRRRSIAQKYAAEIDALYAVGRA